MNALAIITARGGSKRIPRKNIKEFMGKPMIAYAIDACKDSGIFDEIMVSTDDDEIATVAREFGANVPFMRSAKNSDDYATTNDVLTEVLEQYQKRGIKPSVVC
ncbi:MAG: pseudaminic acid cytidylyltransferase, partial [Campylobacter sp.]|nr:pseudaminic acid cytidylyltransferase [Campylobacter sp.]